MTISFKVSGQPQGKARPRFVNGHIYTPKCTKIYEADVKKLIQLQLKDITSKMNPFRQL